MALRPKLHPSIVALISLASSIAAKHPDLGRRYVAQLRELGVPEHQIAQAVEIARSIREAAAETYDSAFEETLHETGEVSPSPGSQA